MNHLWASEKENLRQSWKMVRLIFRMKPDTAIPWVCWVSGIQGLQFSMGSLDLVCSVSCDSILVLSLA